MDKINNIDLAKLFETMMEKEKNEKLKRYQVLNSYVKKGQILFVGSSLMEQFPIYEFIQNYDINATIYNRGIGGYTTFEMIKALDTMVFDLKPSKIFINIGTNDLNDKDCSIDELVKRYEEILNKIIQRLPNTMIYVMAYYPINSEHDFGNEFMKQVLMIRTNERIQAANKAIEEMSNRLGIRFIDVNQNLKDDKGNLKAEYSVDGMHMYASGYQAILEDLLKYIKE